MVINVQDVHKRFKTYHDKTSVMKEKLLNRKRAQFKERWVLNGISFTAKRGDCIGIIGENGCGKSTLLKLMTRIMYPEKGKIEVTGRVSSLIELGAGFHAHMSGRENIYTNAAIFGLSRKEIDKRVQDIIDFSELGSYIDSPVRTYSSGMYMRLAFSVAINVDADVLLIDEILAVGDAAFQAKCFNKLKEIKANGVTIVIVSHSLAQIEQMCNRTIWINDGLIKLSGTPRDVHPAYMEYMSEKLHHGAPAEPEPPEPVPTQENTEQEQPGEEQQQAKQVNRWGSKEFEITSVELLNKDGRKSDTFKTGEPVKIAINFKARIKNAAPVFGIAIHRNDGVNCYGTNTFIDRISFPQNKAYKRAEFVIERNNLLSGEYMLDVAIHKEDGFAFDFIKDVLRFNVFSALQEVGVCRLDHGWNFR